jgi:hypothetical protein
MRLCPSVFLAAVLALAGALAYIIGAREEQKASIRTIAGRRQTMRVSPPSPTVGPMNVDNAISRLTGLYSIYGEELKTLWTFLVPFCKGRGCASDDMELEISYMRIREEKPTVLWEISPHQGYSTIVLLTALKANGRGRLVSFDLKDDCSSNIPTDLSTGRWSLVIGDFRTLYSTTEHPRPTYVFLDSFHSHIMADFYTTTFFPWLGNGHIFVSLHDVYNPLFWTDPNPARDMRVYPEWMPNEEGLIVVDWLKDQPDMCGVYTFASSRNELQKKRFSQLKSVRDKAVGEQYGLQKYTNPTLFFELHCPGRSA